MLMPSTKQALLELLSEAGKTSLTVSPATLAMLRARGLWPFRPEHAKLKDWDDEYNVTVKNGHDRTVMHIGLDFLKAMLDRQFPKRLAWFYGQPGRGKTNLALILAVVWAAITERSVAYMNWPMKMQDIVESIRSNGDETMMLENQVSLLVVDDLGPEKNSLYRLELLYRLLESRRGKVTIVTSNWPLNRGAAQSSIFTRLDKSTVSGDDPALVAMYAGKIESRLSFGDGGFLAAEVKFDSVKGDHRKL